MADAAGSMGQPDAGCSSGGGDCRPGQGGTATARLRLAPAPPAPARLISRWLLAARARFLLGGVVAHGDPGRREVALTFDDGPSAEHTPAVLALLRERRVPATFFMLGRHVGEHPGIARAAAAGHEIGFHSQDHERGAVASLAAFREDLSRCRAVIDRELGVVPRLYRFPWGAPGAVSAREVLALEGLTCVHWSGSAEESLDAPSLARRLGRHLTPGAILLLHDGVAPNSVQPRPRTQTLLALPLILDEIAARGLRPVTVSALLRLGPPPPPRTQR